MDRREFLKGSAMAGAVISFSGTRAWAKASDARIEIFTREPVGEISPNIYGQFTEHIGGVIYDGIWVGENSKIPNRYGIRAELIDKLKQIHVPVIRWPGGCFADSYDWMDGIGPASSRPTRTNFWEVDPDARRLHEKGPQIFESNRFGTNEFMRFCKLSGAKPYLAVNVRSLPALSFDRWVEYCNSPAGSTTLAGRRAAAGFLAPFDVQYWGVGNESWGCGGNFTPEEYASVFRRYTSWVPQYGINLQFIASGPSGADLDWTHRFFEEIYSRPAYNNASFTGWSLHFYSSVSTRSKATGWKLEKGDALQFDSVDWYEMLHESNRIDKIIQDQWAVMGQYDATHRVKLVVDEYGAWYRDGTELDPTDIFGQQITIRDALVTALTLDTFNRNAEKVSMAANAQLINNLNALFFAHEDRFVATPNFYVFAMYAAHQGAQGVRAEFSAADVQYSQNGRPGHLWGLNGSASQKGNVVTLTVVNPHLTKQADTQIALQGARIAKASGTVLAASDMHAHNTFDQPDIVKPASLSVSINGDILTAVIPPASVSKFEMIVG